MYIYRGGKEKEEREEKEGEIRQQNHELQNFIMCRTAHSHTKADELEKKVYLETIENRLRRVRERERERKKEKKENECISK